MKSAVEKRKTGQRGEVRSWRRRSTVLFIGVLIIFTLPFWKNEATAQERRSLRVWVDTLDLNLCDAEEDLPFDDWGVWLETASETDTVIGFRLLDSVVSCKIDVRWDVSRVRLEPPYVLIPPQTLFGRFFSKVQDVDTNAGQLYVEVSANPFEMRPAVGIGIPLFYMRGRFLKTDTAIGPPEGGAKTNGFEIIDGALRNNISTSRFVPGFVRVLRDTTPEYTGTLKVSDGNLDTNRVDTVSLLVRNLIQRNVREISFSLKADTTAFKFVDTITTTSLSPLRWSTRELTVAPDIITGHFVSDTDIDSEDSLVLRIQVERTLDTAFKAFLTIDEFYVNDESCLGKLVVEQGVISGETIPVPDTTDTTVSVVERWRERREGIQVVMMPEANAFQVIAAKHSVESVAMYNLTGVQIQHWTDFKAGKEVVVKMERNLQSGIYFLVIRDTDGIFWNRQFIQQR